jgi:hypothetical protein
MAFLDFIKNRQQASQEQSSQPKPETAREMYAREAQQERSNAKPVDQDMKPEQRAVMGEVQAKMRGATQHLNENAAPDAVPADATASPQTHGAKNAKSRQGSSGLKPDQHAGRRAHDRSGRTVAGE